MFGVEEPDREFRATSLDKERLRGLEIGGKVVAEYGTWTCHRYVDSYMILVEMPPDAGLPPFFEAKTLELAFKILKCDGPEFN